MTKLRVGIVLVAVATVFSLAFLVGSDTFTTLGPQTATRGEVFTYLMFGVAIPAVTVSVGILLMVFGRRQVARTGRPEDADSAPTAAGPPGWREVLPVPGVVALFVANVFVGAFAYGGGEVYGSPAVVHLSARIISRWEDCERGQITPHELAMLITRGVWQEANVRRCADCLDEHPRCSDRTACAAACAVPPEPVPTIGEFGGQVEPAFFGTWELVNGNGTHARMIYDANGFQKILDGDPNVVRGQWRVRPSSDQWNTWEFLHVPAGGNGDPWIEAVESMGNTRFRWLDGGLEFELQRTHDEVDAGPSQARIDECRRSCSRWRSCMRDMSDTYYCQDEMSRACRECRDQGLGR